MLGAVENGPHQDITHGPRDRVGKMPGDNGKQVGGGGAIVSGMDVREGPPTGSTSPTVLAVHGEGPHRTGECDRSGRCYRCGQPGHTATNCNERPNCPVCKDQGRVAGHRCGKIACKAPARRGRNIAIPNRPPIQANMEGSPSFDGSRRPTGEAMDTTS